MSAINGTARLLDLLRQPARLQVALNPQTPRDRQRIGMAPVRAEAGCSKAPASRTLRRPGGRGWRSLPVLYPLALSWRRFIMISAAPQTPETDVWRNAATSP